VRVSRFANNGDFFLAVLKSFKEGGTVVVTYNGFDEDDEVPLQYLCAQPKPVPEVFSQKNTRGVTSQQATVGAHVDAPVAASAPAKNVEDVEFTDTEKKAWDKRIVALAKAEKVHAEKEDKSKEDAARVQKEAAEKAKADKVKKVQLEKKAKDNLKREKTEAAQKAKAEMAKAPTDVASELKEEVSLTPNDSNDASSQQLTADVDGKVEPTERGIYPEGCVVEVLCGVEGEEVWVPARVDEVLQYEDRVSVFINSFILPLL
jgi:hypothetical protein